MLSHRCGLDALIGNLLRRPVLASSSRRLGMPCTVGENQRRIHGDDEVRRNGQIKACSSSRRLAERYLIFISIMQPSSSSISCTFSSLASQSAIVIPATPATSSSSCDSTSGELVRNVDIAASASDSQVFHLGQRRLLALGLVFNLPLGAAEGASHLVLHTGPLVEAALVDVVATRGLAPDDVLPLLEIHEANRAFARYLFAVAVLDVLFGDLDWEWWRVGEELLQLRSEEGSLV